MSRPTSAQNISGLSLAAAKTRLYAASDACFLQHCVGKCDLKLPDASPAFRFAAAQRVQANLPSVFFRRTGAQLFRRWTECFTLRSIVAGGVFLNFHAAFPRPSCFCVQLWSPLLEFNAKRRHPGPLKGRGLLQKFLTSASGKAVNYELDVVDAAGGF